MNLGGLAGRRAPQRCADSSEQLLRPERLGDVVVGAGIERLDLIGLGVPHRQHDDRDFGVGPDQAAGLDAAKAGHVHVEHDQIDALAAAASRAPLPRFARRSLRTPGRPGSRASRGGSADRRPRQECARRSWRAPAASVIRNDVPDSSASRATSPPCARAICRTIANPMPLPAMLLDWPAAIEPVEHPRRVVGCHLGTGVVHDEIHRAAGRSWRRADGDRRARARILDGVVSQVAQGDSHQTAVNLHHEIRRGGVDERPPVETGAELGDASARRDRARVPGSSAGGSRRTRGGAPASRR